MILTAKETEAFTWLFFEAAGGKIDRSVIAPGNITYPDIQGTKGLILVHGNLPPWVIAPATSHYRNRCQWQAWYDAKEKGAIVVFSFIPEIYPVGMLIEDPLPCLICNQPIKKGAIQPYCVEHREHSLSRQRYQPRTKP